jgi:hypothetical protein
MGVKTQLPIYAKIESPFLDFLLKFLPPLVGKLADPKIGKAQGVVRQASELIAQDPQKAYSRIAESGQLATEDLMTFRKLMTLPGPSAAGKDEPFSPHRARSTRGPGISRGPLPTRQD